MLLMIAMMILSCMLCSAETMAEEMAVRTAAEEYVFALAQIVFYNCEFNGDVILTADEATRVSARFGAERSVRR